MQEALQVIIVKSPAAAAEAADTLRALQARSPITSQRYSRALAAALADPQADFTGEDRRLLAAAIAEPTGSRSYTLHLRLNTDERDDLERRAQDAGLNMSEYARRQLWPNP